MLRTILFLSLGTLICAVAFGGTPSELTTYVDGNLTGVSPNSASTLQFPDDQAMVFKSGDNSFQIPYARIRKAELSEPKIHTHHVPLYEAPFYKTWTVSKHFIVRTQLLTVAFQNDEGKDVSMTLELARATAGEVLATINGYTGKGPVVGPPPVKLTDDQVVASGPANTPKNSWWGDDFWKTARNSDKWNNIQAAAAPQQ